MHTLQDTPENWEQELQQLSPALQAHIRQLEADSRILHDTFVLDMYPAPLVSWMVSNSFMEFATSQRIREAHNSEELAEKLRHLHERFGGAVLYLSA